jgi:uncharacterized protein
MKSLVIYFVILVLLCAGIVVGARMLGEIGYTLGRLYMLTPAIAAIITRLFFHPLHFKDANLRFGRLADYFKYWLWALAIVALYYVFYTLLGAIRWDLSGDAFLAQLTQQFATAGQDINAGLPEGWTPRTMMMLYLIGGLTIFNIPYIIAGFGEEFGHRGFMFPSLYRIHPWVGLVVGGLIWYAWHWPILLIVPQASSSDPLWLNVINFIVLGIGSMATFTYLAYVYVKSRSVFVTSIAHIAMNNAAGSLAFLCVVQSQFLANLGTVLAMVIVVAILYYRREFNVFAEYFAERERGEPSSKLVAKTEHA